jgi:glycosyl transferase family 87
VAVSARQARLQLAPGRTALAVVGVFAVALALLAAVHRGPGSPARLSEDQAMRAALDDASVRTYLADTGFTRDRVTPIDDRLVRVSFFDGSRIVLDAAVAPDGRVTNQIPYRPGYVRVGGELAQRPLALALLLAAFALAMAVAPVRSMRNLDVIALASFAVPVVLMNERLLEASVYLSYPPLAYLCGRCAYVALEPRGRPDMAAPPLVRPSPRILGIAVAAAAVVLVLLTIPAGLVGDVAFASMAGATDLVHGTLPYGHLAQTELVHGDTYPLLAYAAYVPAAILTPVHTAFDQLDGALWVAAAFALAAAVAMFRTGGLRLALAWLTFPPVLIAASAGSNDVVAAACVAWATALIVHSGRSTLALTIAGWVKLGPLIALPAWIARGRGRDLPRAALAAAAVTAAVALWVVSLDAFGGLGDMVEAISFQAERGSLLSLWTLTGSDAAQVAVQAAVATLLVAAVVQVRRDPALARDPRRVAALAAALLLGTQLAANYWTYTYLTWAFPLVALALLGARGATRARARRPALRPEGHP